MKSLLPAVALATVAAPAILSGASAPQSALEVGQTPEYTFRSAPLNSMGVTSLAELRGKPVLVEFWGTR